MQPKEVVVVANKRMRGSEELARYYMEKRNIPQSHLVSLSLNLKETIDRDEFDKTLRKPLHDRIAAIEKDQRIAAIVLMYGVPLKVDPPKPDWDALDKIRELALESSKLDNDSTDDLEEVAHRKKVIAAQLDSLRKTSWRASVDSELFLVKADDFDPRSWLVNPFYLGRPHSRVRVSSDDVIVVSRIDGPDLQTGYRIINDSLETERDGGLKGTAYFDARWKRPDANRAKKATGYARYDLSIHRAADIVRDRMKVVLDEQSALFPVNSCPQAALYCGWYSLARYIDSFQWQKGAVAFHIASAECASLRNTKRNFWCLRMLEKGVAATIGPVNEPFVQGFPMPEIFFSELSEGYMSLGEAYLVSLPYISWQMVMVGDPLYQPFQPMN